MRNQERQHRAANSQGNLKVLDFSADNDQEGDSNGEQTGASLNAGALPFTICSSLTAEAWPTKSARECSHCLMTAANGDIFTCLPSWPKHNAMWSLARCSLLCRDNLCSSRSSGRALFGKNPKYYGFFSRTLSQPRENESELINQIFDHPAASKKLAGIFAESFFQTLNAIFPN